MPHQHGLPMSALAVVGSKFKRSDLFCQECARSEKWNGFSRKTEQSISELGTPDCQTERRSQNLGTTFSAPRNSSSKHPRFSLVGTRLSFIGTLLSQIGTSISLAGTLLSSDGTTTSSKRSANLPKRTFSLFGTAGSGTLAIGASLAKRNDSIGSRNDSIGSRND